MGRSLRFLATAVAILCATSCKRDRPTPDGNAKIRSLVERLRSADAKTREPALAELRQLGKTKKLSPAEGAELLRATALEFPGSTPGLWDTQSSIIATVAQDPQLEYLPIIQELFPRWSPSARGSALDLLSAIDDTTAAEAFMVLFRRHANELSSPTLIRLQQTPHHPEVFFPGLLELASIEARANDIYLTTLAFCQGGRLPPDKLARHTAPVLTAYQAERDWLLPRQRDKGSAWIWEEDYQDHRERAALLLDLFGCLPVETVENELRRAAGFRDARLAHFAVTSLLAHGKPVPAATLDTVAASPEMRIWLYENLKKKKRLDLFPRRYLTQEAFAESEMVRWLAFPTELGRAPDEIVLGKVIPVDTHGPDGVLDYYVFRFRTLAPHWAAEKGWTAGIAGPFLRKDAPNPEAYGGTFSSFEAWESKTPEQHLGDIRELLEEWSARRPAE